MAQCKRAAVVFAVGIAVANAAAQQPAPGVKVLKVEDYLNYETVADPQISPDGAQIVYTRRWVNQSEDKMEASLWVMNADGSRNRFLTKGSDAEWSPDGTRIAYIADGEQKAATGLRPLDDRERGHADHAGPARAVEPAMVAGREADRADDARAQGGEVGHPAAEATRRREMDQGARGDRQAALQAGPCRVHRGRFHARLCRACGWRHSSSADFRRLERGRPIRRHGRNRWARLDSRRPHHRRRRPRRAGRGSPLSRFGRLRD